MKNVDREEIDFLVITIIEIETEALNSFGFENQIDRSGRGYYKKKYFNNIMNREISIVHYSLGEQGNVSAGVIVSDLLNLWIPKCVCVVGIAGGIKSNNVKIGDILVGTQIFYYPLSKETTDSSERRIEAVRGDTSILSQIRSFKGKILDYLSGHISKLMGIQGQTPELLFGPIFSGESVQASKVKTSSLLDIHPKGIGIEMESYGVYRACLDNPLRPRPLTIRSVSDLADEEKNDEYHRLAAYNAALFFVAITQLCDLRFIESYSKIDSIPEKREIVGNHTDFPHIFEVSQDSSERTFIIRGNTDFIDFQRIIVPYTLKCWVFEEYTHSEHSSIQVGVDVEISGCLRRLNALGYSSLLVEFVVYDAYYHEIARITVPKYPRTIGSIILKFIEPLELDVSHCISSGTHFPIVGFLNVPVYLNPGPYWIGVECNLGLIYGGSMGGVSPENPMTIKIGTIEIYPNE